MFIYRSRDVYWALFSIQCERSRSRYGGIKKVLEGQIELMKPELQEKVKGCQ